jgi:hypothetical protein
MGNMGLGAEFIRPFGGGPSSRASYHPTLLSDSGKPFQGTSSLSGVTARQQPVLNTVRKSKPSVIAKANLRGRRSVPKHGDVP